MLEGLLPSAGQIFGATLGFMGQADTNRQNANQAQANRDFNASEAEKARGFNSAEAEIQRQYQTGMASTSYQRAVGDLKTAGLNPMLAYMNGGSPTPTGAQASGPAASSSAMPVIGNKTASALAAAQAMAQIENIKSQTKVNDVQAEKVVAETNQSVASTGEINQRTTNLKEGLRQIGEQINLTIKQGNTQVADYNLKNAQREVQETLKQLNAQQITESEARTKLLGVETTLKNYETAGAKNQSDYEKMLDTGGGNASKAAGAIANTIQTIRKVIGK